MILVYTYMLFHWIYWNQILNFLLFCFLYTFEKGGQETFFPLLKKYLKKSPNFHLHQQKMSVFSLSSYEKLDKYSSKYPLFLTTD